FKQLLSTLTTPGDTATVLLAGTAGFVLDAGLNIVGFLEPGYVGFTFATTALGVKRAWEAGRQQRALESRARSMRSYAVQIGRADLATHIDEELSLLKATVHDRTQAEEALDRIAAEFPGAGY
ncbi:MAG TPA: hypothetical protein VFI62_16445, partial [Burkholderiales bacterium]|nr:hypothetical protein [Burkholderiales bacterium]